MISSIVGRELFEIKYSVSAQHKLEIGNTGEQEKLWWQKGWGTWLEKNMEKSDLTQDIGPISILPPLPPDTFPTWSFLSVLRPPSHFCTFYILLLLLPSFSVLIQWELFRNKDCVCLLYSQVPRAFRRLTSMCWMN